MASNGPIRRTVTVRNPMGLHMRPATRFAQAARAFRSSITVRHGDKSADGKSSLDLILLVALEGSQLILEIDGDDAHQAIEPLSEILAAMDDDC
jgi:phosphotransferase system HPr (HPr) family protein